MLSSTYFSLTLSFRDANLAAKRRSRSRVAGKLSGRSFTTTIPSAFWDEPNPCSTSQTSVNDGVKNIKTQLTNSTRQRKRVGKESWVGNDDWARLSRSCEHGHRTGKYLACHDNGRRERRGRDPRDISMADRLPGNSTTWKEHNR